MNKFIKSVRGGRGAKEALIKSAITTQLSNGIKEVQLFGMDENLSGDSMDMSEAESNICTVIEAMFLHGLKDSFSHRFKRAITDVDVKPEPSFWAPLLVISHKQTIDQIHHLSQINTEIGQCRAWIRLVLNDCLLSSYLTTIKQDPSALKPYYNTEAYLRDNEVLDVAQRLIEGLETIRAFLLPCNSSLLNSWPLPSLILAGVWAPTLRSCPVSSGVDVAESLQATSSINSETSSLASESINSFSSGIGQMLPMNEDEALKIILAKHSAPQIATIEEHKSISEASECQGTSDSDIHPPLGNSLKKKSGWSFDQNQPSNSHESLDLPPEPKVSETEPDSEQSMENSFNALIQSYNMFGGNVKTPDIREVLQQFEASSGSEKIADVKTESLTSVHLTKTESVALAAQIGKVAKEKGLDFHNFECSACRHPLGLSHKPKVCNFTGSYYCDNCMSVELMTIPARIIHNWDFKRYPVSQRAYNYIEEVKEHPTIDLKILNPHIYAAVEEMSELLVLRNQLNFLRAYLYTCQEPIIEQLQKQMWPREYMYEHVHQYSISDLSQITDGTLAVHLQKVVSFGRQHVLNCWLCSQKGFICEICNKSKPLFPFDVEHIYRCEVCSAVYHKGCLNASKPCPKCERRKRREDLPLLGATID